MAKVPLGWAPPTQSVIGGAPSAPQGQKAQPNRRTVLDSMGISSQAHVSAQAGDSTIAEKELIAKGYSPDVAATIAGQLVKAQQATDNNTGNTASKNIYSLMSSNKPAVDPATGQPATAQSKEEQIARAMTNRQMSLLQQEMGKQRAQGIAGLRGNLANRGLMDSGSLGSGIGKINRDIGERTAQGALMAANQEGSTLLDFMRQQRQEDAQRRQMQMGNQFNIQNQRWQEGQNSIQRDWEQRQRNKDRQAQMWNGLGSAAGGAFGGWASGGFKNPFA